MCVFAVFAVVSVSIISCNLIPAVDCVTVQMAEAIEVNGAAFRAHHRSEVTEPPHTKFAVGSHGPTLIKAAHIDGASPALGLKVSACVRVRVRVRVRI